MTTFKNSELKGKGYDKHPTDIEVPEQLEPVGKSEKPTISFNLSDWYNRYIKPILTSIDGYLTNKAAEIIKLSVPAWFYFAIIGVFIIVLILVL